MSSFFKESKYNNFQKDTQWLNNIIGCHDIYCFCDHPWMHLLESLLQRGSKFELSNKEVRIIQKCLISIAKDGEEHGQENPTTSGKDDDDFNLDEGDLQQLFDVEKETG